MKVVRFFKNLSLIVLVLALTACSKDDENSGSSLMSDVPSGEIVPVDQRNEVLVGYDFDNLQKNSNMEQKWWKYEEFNITYDCPSNYDESDNVHKTYEDTYVAFKEDGYIYLKEGFEGWEQQLNQWEWTSSAKDYITVTYSDGSSVDFEVRELNPNSVVYASLQGEGNCHGVTWERCTGYY